MIYHGFRKITRMWLFSLFSAIRPESLRTRVELGPKFLHHALGKNIGAFKQHIIKLSEGFQLVDNEMQKRLKFPHPRWQQGDAKPEPPRNLPKGHYRTKNVLSKKIPGRTYDPQKAEELRHYLKDWTAYPEDKKKALFKQIAEKKAKTEPSRPLRARKTSAESSRSEVLKVDQQKVAGHINPPYQKRKSTLLTVTLCVRDRTMFGCGCADNGSLESIVSTKVAKSDIWNGIGNCRKFPQSHFKWHSKTEKNRKSLQFHGQARHLVQSFN